MKPSFALSLSHQGIRLFSRAKGGWRLVGETDLDTPDLGDTLAYLRDKAAKLSGSGLATKLILPSEQILYTSVTAPGPDDETRLVQIRAALADMTPYDPSELAFDWRISGDLVSVAAVAKETLQEAEAFAIDHRFNPVSFVGDVGEAGFQGEPFFGPTEFSRSFIDDNDTVETDDEPFVIIDKKQKKGKIFSGNLQKSVLLTPTAEVKPEPTNASQDTANQKTPTAENSPPEPIQEQPSDKKDALESGKERLSKAIGTAPTDKETEHETNTEDSAPSDTTDEPQLDAFFLSIQAKKTVIDVETPQIPDHLLKAKGTTSVPPSIAGQKTPFTANRDSDSAIDGFVHRPIVSGAPPAALAAHLNTSIKTPSDAAPVSEADTASDASSNEQRVSSALRAQSETSAVEPSEFSSSRKDAAPLQEYKAADVVAIDGGTLPAVATETVPAPTSKPPIISESAQSEPQQTVEERLADANITSADLELPDSEDMGSSLGLEATRARDTDYRPEMQLQLEPDVTAFGAAKAKKAAEKPRNWGVLLMIALILVMGLVVLWSLFTSSPQKLETSETPVAGTFADFNTTLESPAQGLEGLPVVTNSPAIISPVSIDSDQVAAISGTGELPFITDEELLTADQSVDISEPESPVPLTQVQAEEAYSDTGIWQKSPEIKSAPKVITTDSLYVSSLDPELNLLDAVALPIAKVQPDDFPLPLQASPAPAGSVFALGDNGFVVPSAEGTMNPDGVMVFSGPPPKRSVARPNTGETRLPATTEGFEVVNRRPLARPDNLAEIREIAQLGGRTLSQLARLRPTPRPISEQIAAQTNTDGEVANITATKFAVSTSRVPTTRPAGFASLVEKARVDPVNIEKKATTTAAVTKTRVVTSSPKIPTRASVAKEATQANKIKMRKVSLIGVYGTPSKRSALVRMGNGKIIEVSIGDRVDGGKVAAIGADQVRYVKGGRNILLKMPPRG